MADSVQMREELLRRFIESGERERLQEILRSKLLASGWQDRVKDRCQRAIRESESGIDKVTVDEIAEKVTPFARAEVPEDIKSELLEQARAFVYRSIPDTDS
ncbi:hypothetical protein FBU59_002210 [Linderina macrospora]|uniref:Uncharacterized protein n=1 Tax=Linderina macrospora TaxID=4868 RepID=A0ACC1JC15_9FUNG|nr:hypothetical protein FBU59_002210 [Linderina macrospora]